MDIEKYTELTGITVKPSQEAKVKAVIRRTRSKLEGLLGFSLKSKNLYTEKGKVQFEGYYPISDLENLLPADEEEGTYKLFPYSEKDSYFHTDPFKNVYHVKLVAPINDNEFITVYDLDDYILQAGKNGIKKYIKRNEGWFEWPWYDTWQIDFAEENSRGLQLAIDADWVDCLNDDILYLWADMVSYYSDKNYSVSGSIRSESVDGHSWARGNAGGGKDGDTSPENTAEGRRIVETYAGPFGAAARNRAW